MLRQLITTFFISLVAAIAVNAQSSSQPADNNNNARVIPAPPNVASLIKVADIPVSNYNGTAQTTIPLYTLEAGDLKVPISINYYNNGLKVTEEASWVGFGWNLNAGGVIHQNIVGNPDYNFAADGNRQVSNAPLPLDMPTANNSDLDEPNRLGHGCTYLDYTFKEQYFPATQIVNNGSQTTGGDNEFDLFLYNFGSYSGKFIYPNYPTTDPVLLDRNNIKFKYSNSGFIATTPDGTQYIFSTIGKTVTPSSSCFVGTQQPSITSLSFYLTKIISPDGNVATFIYKEYDSTTLPTLSQTYSLGKIGGSGTYLASQGFANDFILNFGGGSSSTSDNTTFTRSQVQNFVLDSIKTANAVVKFTTSARTDVDQGVKLDNISIYRIGEVTPLKSFSFSYSYFNGDATYGDWMTDNNVALGCTDQTSLSFNSLPSTALRSQRLKLNSLQISGNGASYTPPYQFYYDASSLPYKTSLAQDLWGYFNGQQNHSLLPNYNYMGYYDSYLPLTLSSISKTLGIRKCVPQYLQAGILKTIVNPTGGYTKITYEPNQFTNLPTLTSQVKDTLISVTDATKGTQTLEFDVPDVGYKAVVSSSAGAQPYNQTTLNVLLVNPEHKSDKPNSGGCQVTPGFNAYNTASGADNTNALYALIQRQDPSSGNWLPPTSDNIYDLSNANSQLQSGTECGANNISKLLSPGHYRIVANYPDNKTGNLPEPSAFISITYKYKATQSFSNYGGGLRVKSVTEYTDVNHLYNQKIYSYYSGRLMTKPVFYRNFLSFDDEIRATFDQSNEPGTQLGQLESDCDGGQVDIWPVRPEVNTPTELPVASLSLYSNPLLNYSYSASGAIVGYDTVKVDYSSGQDIGQSMYTYINIPDNIHYYPGLLPGSPGGSNITNGMLLSEQEFKKNTDGSLGKLKEEDNTWVVNNFQDYWAYKSEYVQPWAAPCTNGGGSAPATGTSLYYNYLHFYPVKAGKVVLSGKTETYYDSANPYSITTGYGYNSQNQLNYKATTKSDGRADLQKTYYPGDYTSSDFTTTMRAKNMLDYPIEVINYTTGKDKSTPQLTQSAVYKQYYVHDNIVSPQKTYLYNASAPSVLVPSAPTNVKDSTHYELRESYQYDAYGNEISEQKTNGPITNYVWDYQHLYPIAKVNNTSLNDFAYTSFEADGKGNWSFTGTPAADNTAPIGKFSYNLANGSITNSNLSSSKTYVVSYWTNSSAPLSVTGTLTGYPVLLRTLNGWYNYQHKVTGITSITISGTGKVDDLRLFPVDADIATYTYDPLIGTSSSTDAKGNTLYYTYDDMQRLYSAKNLHGDVVKMYNYHYAGFNGISYQNGADTAIVTKNNCTGGYVGGSAKYIVPAGSYTSYVSQASANDLALADIQVNGQEYANTNCGCQFTCTPPTITSIINTSGSANITVNCTAASVGSTTYVLSVYDMSTNQQVSATSVSGISSGAIHATSFVIGLPVKDGRTYKFNITTYSPNCSNITPTSYSASILQL